MMSVWRKRNSGARMCSMLARDPVSTLSTQMTRWPRRRSSSQRCEPRNPAPPVTRQVGMTAQGIASAGGRPARQRPAHRPDTPRRYRPGARAEALARPGRRELLLLKVPGDPVDAQLDPLGQAFLLEPLAHERAPLAPRAALAAALLGL